MPAPVRPSGVRRTLSFRLKWASRARGDSINMHHPAPKTTSGHTPKFARVLTAALVVLCCGQAASLASGLNGIWRIDVTKKWGVTLHTFLILRQNGDRIEGDVVVNNSGRIPIRQPRWESGEAVFDIDWGWTFRVRPDGTNLHVVMVFGKSRQEEATAYPASEADLAAPPALPLPPLQELPANGLARTPPMGWNSWNHFAEAVDDRTVRETAEAMVASGMAGAGYTYVNIDDTWEGTRDAGGNLTSNTKFPDMAALAAYVHSKGLRIGIYSSPGPYTCGGYEGSHAHEDQDAKTFAAWGIDYLKYDWCSAGRIYGKSDLRPVYQRMGEALQRCGRPIVFSLCEYGMGDVWTWGPLVGANLWRTTGDIQDNWNSMSRIGFSQGRLAPYAAPGHWNDPDMLEVGNGGMSEVEYKTHFSLWCMLAAPLMAGNDLRTMSRETREILTNREVIRIDQDSLGRQATRVWEKEGLEIWTKPLHDGAEAIGLFNRNDATRTAAFPWTQIGLPGRPSSVRDLWRHLDLTPIDNAFRSDIPAHGVILLTAR
jgi:alpha-galactosidase